MTDGKGTCFVVMGFGKKTDFETGRTLDLDRSYRNLIKPAVEEAGFRCVRADEIVHSGLIDVPMYEQLMAADIVVADLSTSNKNAFYELGIRHALRPYTTIVIAEDSLKAPFDINHVVVRSYKHLGEDIGYDEVMRFRKLLTEAIAKIVQAPADARTDSPVYRFLSRLAPPMLREMEAAVRAAAPADPAPAAATHSMLMQQVDDAVRRGDFLAAKSLLGAIWLMMKSDATDRDEERYIVQRLALVTYKSKHPDEATALQDAQALISRLTPSTSHDTETLGLWGSVHKRLWAHTGDIADLNEAIRAHERGFYLRNDHYNGINLAFLLNVRAARAGDTAEAIADFVLARRVRSEVLDICRAGLAALRAAPSATPQGMKQMAERRYWMLATAGEALLGLGDPGAQAQLDEAYAAAPEPWMADTTREQIAKLQPLLADSPLKHVARA